MTALDEAELARHLRRMLQVYELHLHRNGEYPKEILADIKRTLYASIGQERTTPDTYTRNGEDGGMQQLFTLDQVSHATQLSVKTLTREIDDGRLKSVTIRRCRRVALEDLEAYVESLRSQEAGTHE